MRGGKKQNRVFCESYIRDGSRKCYAKGFPTKNGKLLCRWHGFQNIQGFNKPNFPLESKIKQLKGLVQFREKSNEEIKKHIEEVITPRINKGTSEYHRKQTVRRSNIARNLRRGKFSDQVNYIVQTLQKKPRT